MWRRRAWRSRGSFVRGCGVGSVEGAEVGFCAGFAHESVPGVEGLDALGGAEVFEDGERGGGGGVAEGEEGGGAGEFGGVGFEAGFRGAFKDAREAVRGEVLVESHFGGGGGREGEDEEGELHCDGGAW